MSLKIVDFPQSAVHTPKALALALRELAEDLEKGTIPEVARIHLLFEHENATVSYAAIGKACSDYHRIGVFTHAGIVLSETMD